MKSRIPIIAVAVIMTLAGIFTACEDNSVSAPGEQTYTGTVLDASDKPIVSATVQAVDDSNVVISSDVTDSVGNFKLLKLPKNFETLYLRITHPDYAVYKEKIITIEENLKNKSDKNNDILLSKKDSCCGKVAVKVLDSLENSALQGVTIRITQEGAIIDTARTDDFGMAYFNHYCDGTYQIRIAKDGYHVKETSFTVTECDTLALTYQLLKADSCCKGNVFINLKDVNGNYLDGAKFNYVNSESFNILNGKLTLQICEGSYTGWIKKEGYQTQEIHFTVNCNGNTELNKTLIKDSTACCGVITVKVTDPNNTPLTGKAVTLRKGTATIATVNTGEHGIAYFQHICNADYNIRIALDNYNVFEYSFSFQGDCDTTAITAKLTPKQNGDTCCKGTLYLKALNGEGNLIGSCMLYLSKGGTTASYQSTDGSFNKLICEGTYSAKLTKDGYKNLEFSVEIGCNDTTIIQKTMIPDSSNCCGVVKVIVKDESQKAISNARVALGKGNATLSDPRTNGDGGVIFYHICSGDYWLNISADHFETKEYDFTQNGNCDTTSIIINLKAIPADTCCHGILKVNVFNANNNEKLVNCSVTISKSGQVVETVHTNGDGNAVIDGICTGAYSVKITRDGFVTQSYDVSFVCNETKSFEKGLTPIQQTCCGKFYGYVFDHSTNTPISNAQIKLTDENGTVITLTTNDQGKAQRFELCNSKYSVRISKDGYNVYETSFTIEHCDTVNMEAGLQSNTCCDRIVKFSSMNEDSTEFIDGVKFQAFLNGNLVSESTTENGNPVVLNNLCAGTYTFKAIKDGLVSEEMHETLNCNHQLYWFVRKMKKN